MNELAIYNPDDLTSEYYGKKPTNVEETKALYRAVNNPSHKMSDAINRELKLVNIYIQPATVTDNITGEVKILPKTVLITEDGESYVAVSTGIFNSVSHLITLFGGPIDWKEPISITIKQLPTKNGSMLSIDLI